MLNGSRQAQSQVAILGSGWMQAQGVRQSLLQRNVDVVEVHSIDVLSEICVPGQQLMLLIPAHTDDAVGGYRYVRQARQAYGLEALKIVLITDVLKSVLREWIAKQGADYAFELPEQKVAFLQRVCSHVGASASPAATPQFSSDLLEELTRQLTVHVGPIANILVSDAAAAAESEKQLCNLLSESIDDKAGKRAFMDAMFEA